MRRTALVLALVLLVPACHSDGPRPVPSRDRLVYVPDYEVEIAQAAQIGLSDVFLIPRDVADTPRSFPGEDINLVPSGGFGFGFDDLEPTQGELIRRAMEKGASLRDLGVDLRGLGGEEGGHLEDVLNGLEDEFLIVESGPDGRPVRARSRRITTGMLLAHASGSTEFFDLHPSRTEVRADVTTFAAAVEVAQTFRNDCDSPVEASYLFPLPRSAAVRDFVMKIGGYEIRGIVREKEEARRIYAAAKAAGKEASLVTQLRPNIFRQNVANVPPGEDVRVEIRYFHSVQADETGYEFVFPMVVAPRYSPAAGARDAATEPVGSSQPAPTRPGDEIEIEVNIDTGVTLGAVECPSHEVEILRTAPSRAIIRLADAEEIENRDFVLRYRIEGERTEFALMTHRADEGGFFAFLLSPARDLAVKDTRPRDFVFLVDASGSMAGHPVAQARAVVNRLLDDLTAEDTFRLLRFSDEPTDLTGGSLPATTENLERARDLVAGLSTDGGTEMLAAIRQALAPSPDPERVRTVCLLSDGQVENEEEIIGVVSGSLAGARFFTLGLDTSPNRYLLDKLAEVGRGVADYALKEESPETTARRFHARVEAPRLQDVGVDFGAVPVDEVFPARIPDLVAGRPVLLIGRYRGGAGTAVTVSGRVGGSPFRQTVRVEFPDWQERHEVLAPLWAREKIERLMDRIAREGGDAEALSGAVTALGLEFRLATAFTSLVAVND